MQTKAYYHSSYKVTPLKLKKKFFFRIVKNFTIQIFLFYYSYLSFFIEFLEFISRKTFQKNILSFTVTINAFALRETYFSINIKTLCESSSISIEIGQAFLDYIIIYTPLERL